MRRLGALSSRMRRCRWSWPASGALVLVVSGLVWWSIGRLLAWCCLG